MVEAGWEDLPRFLYTWHKFDFLVGDHQMFTSQLSDSYHLSQVLVQPGVSFQWDMSDKALLEADQEASLQTQTRSNDFSQRSGRVIPTTM